RDITRCPKKMGQIPIEHIPAQIGSHQQHRRIIAGEAITGDDPTTTAIEAGLVVPVKLLLGSPNLQIEANVITQHGAAFRRERGDPKAILVAEVSSGRNIESITALLLGCDGTPNAVVSAGNSYRPVDRAERSPFGARDGFKGTFCPLCHDVDN